MYRAVAGTRAWVKDGRTLTPDEARTEAAELRMAVVQHARKHAERLSPWFAPDSQETPQQRSNQALPTSIDEWCQNQSMQKTWGDDLAVHCLAEKYGLAITIWKKTAQGEWTRYCFASKFTNDVAGLRQKEKPISIILEEGHYTGLLTPKETRTPKPWLYKTTENKKTILIDLTGGVKSTTTFAPSKKSVRTCNSKSVKTYRSASSVKTADDASLRTYKSSETKPKSTKKAAAQTLDPQKKTQSNLKAAGSTARRNFAAPILGNCCVKKKDHPKKYS